MPATVQNTTNLGNLFQSARGKFYQVTYLDAKPDVNNWRVYDMSMNPPATRMEQLIWYRPASNQRHVEVAFKMQRPLAFISGEYRVEVFVPDLHASVTKAGFAVTTGLDGAGKPVETRLTVDMRAASNEWVPLGDFTLDVDKDPLIGQVRQFDDTPEPLKMSTGKNREISFGPVRWVPLYQLADPLYTALGDPQYSSLQYLNPALQPTLEAQWTPMTVFDLGDTRRPWATRFRRRSLARQLRVDYTLPGGAGKGRYRIEAFIPLIFRTRSSSATYTIKTGVGQTAGTYATTTVKVDQTKFANQWAPLGEFDLDPTRGKLVGQVSQGDDTADVQNIWITFGPIRWVPRFKAEIRPSQQFDMPMGSPDQRKAQIVQGKFAPFQGTPRWLDNWYDATPYLTPYIYGIHTGADLNLVGLEDFLSPVYAAGDGTVTYAGPAGGTWNFIIVIEHPLAWVTLADGRKVQTRVYTRYGHVSNLPPKNPILVKTGDQVLKGQQIGFIGFMKGFTTAAHLHFDVSPTTRLKETPSHWPNWTLLKAAMAVKASDPVGYQTAVHKIQDVVRMDYIDPLQFLADNHNPLSPP